MKNGKVILGVLGGIATGALLGVLFAPDKGSKTRKKIAKKSKDYVDEIGHKFNDLVDDMSHQLRGLKAEARQAAHNGKEMVEAAEEEMRRSTNRKS